MALLFLKAFEDIDVTGTPPNSSGRQIEESVPLYFVIVALPLLEVKVKSSGLQISPAICVPVTNSIVVPFLAAAQDMLLLLKSYPAL